MVLHNAPLHERVHAYHFCFEIVPQIGPGLAQDLGAGIHLNPTPPEEAARYLRDPRIASERKRAFLASRRDLLLRNLAYVARAAAPYAERPDATNLVGFAPRDEGRWMSASWRDSGAGYGNGRFAMDVNVVWVPEALRAGGTIVQALTDLGVAGDLESAGVPVATAWARAAAAWSDTERHFRVSLPPDEAKSRVRARLAALPQPGRAYWQTVFARLPNPTTPIEFLAVALDGVGQPIPVANTDVGTRLYVPEGLTAAQATALTRIVVTPYPVGLLVDGLGPLAANDAYASPDVWAAFDRDAYHSPRVVWGREVNLLLLGLARHADEPSGETEPRVIERMLTRGVLNDGEQIGYAYGLNVGSHHGLRRLSHGGSWAGPPNQPGPGREGCLVQANAARVTPDSRGRRAGVLHGGRSRPVAKRLMSLKSSDGAPIRRRGSFVFGYRLHGTRSACTAPRRRTPTEPLAGPRHSVSCPMRAAGHCWGSLAAQPSPTCRRRLPVLPWGGATSSRARSLCLCPWTSSACPDAPCCSPLTSSGSEPRR